MRSDNVESNCAAGVLFRLLIIAKAMKATVLFIPFLLMGLSLCAADDSVGYRSDLWKMEYYQEEDNEAAEPEASEQRDRTAVLDTGLELAVDKLVANTITIDDGTAMLVDVASPFSSSDSTSSTSTSGGGSKLFARGRASSQSPANEGRDESPGSRGPSFLTLFVALVASVVITSGFVSGGK